MKSFTNTLAALSIFICLIPTVFADDSDDVRGQVESLFAALRAGDGTYYDHHREGFTSYSANGGLLDTTSLEQRRQGYSAVRSTGSRANLRPRHIDVKVYGNTAVATAYITGTRVTPDGKSRQIMERMTQVWTKERGGWTEVHFHASPLLTPPSQ